MSGTAWRVSAALAAALLPLGCGGGDASKRAPREASAATTARPALCTDLRVRKTGRVATEAATELSGLALSRSQPGVLWAHNDSGDRPRLLALAPDGALLADVAVTGAEHVDWEDMAAGPGDTLYLGDIGDNTARRPAVVIYRVTEPVVADGGPGVSTPADRLTLSYPDRAHDAEALLADPSSGALVIVAKSFTGTAGVYVAERPVTGAGTRMRRAGTVSLGIGEAVTAGSVSADGTTIVLRTYNRAFVWPRRPTESLVSALRRRPCTARADLLAEGQGEALALTRNGKAFHTVAEGRRPILRRYAP